MARGQAADPSHTKFVPSFSSLNTQTHDYTTNHTLLTAFAESKLINHKASSAVNSIGNTCYCQLHEQSVELGYCTPQDRFSSIVGTIDLRDNRYLLALEESYYKIAKVPIMDDAHSIHSDSSTFEQRFPIRSKSASEYGPFCGSVRTSQQQQQQDDAPLEPSRTPKHKERETFETSVTTKFSERLARSGLAPLQLPFKKTKLPLLEPVLPSPMSRTDGEQLLPSPASLHSPSTMPRPFPRAEPKSAQSFAFDGNAPAFDYYLYTQQPSAEGHNAYMSLPPPNGCLGSATLQGPMGTAGFMAGLPAFQPETMYNPMVSKSMHTPLPNTLATPSPEHNLDVQYETVPDLSHEYSSSPLDADLDNKPHTQYAPTGFTYQSTPFVGYVPQAQSAHHFYGHESEQFPSFDSDDSALLGPQDTSDFNAIINGDEANNIFNFRPAPADVRAGGTNNDFSFPPVSADEQRCCDHNCKNSSPASHSVTPPRKGKADTGLNFGSFEEAEAAALHRKPPSLKHDDYRQVKNDPVPYIHKLRNAFKANYAQKPQGQHFTTEKDQRDWLNYQDTHMERMSKFDEATIESSCWMVLKNLIEAHRVGMKELKYHKIESEITCSAHVDLIAEAISDYAVIRYDVVRLQRLDELICCTNTAVQRKLANYKGNKNKAQREIQNQQQAEQQGFDYVPVLGNMNAKSKARKRKAVAEDEEEEAELALAPTARATKRARTVEAAADPIPAAAYESFETAPTFPTNASYESVLPSPSEGGPLPAATTKTTARKRKTAAAAAVQNMETKADRRGAGVGSSRQATVEAAAALRSMSRQKVFAGPDPVFNDSGALFE